MSEILLIGNPGKRGKKKRKMSALQAKYFGKRAKPTTSRRKRRRKINPSSHAKRRVIHHFAGPKKVRRRRINPSVRARRRHRNPSLRGAMGSAMPMLKAGAIGATGALGLDLLWGYGKSYLPASIAGSPLAQYAVKLIGAIGVGMIGNKLLKGRGREMAVGATTVVLHDALKAQLQSSFPTLQLGEYLTYAPTVGTMRRAGRLMSTGVGEYMSGLPNDTNNDTMENYGGQYPSGSYSEDQMSGLTY